jgi:O-antigen ligase
VETKRHKYIWPLILSLTVLPAIFYVAIWQNVGFVQTSTSSRMLLSEIAWSSWLTSPILGHGPGTFIDIVGQTFVFVVEFGSPLDSHGFAQKLLVEQGALGLLAYFGVLAYFLWYLIRFFRHENNDRTKFQTLCFVLIFSSMIVFELFSTSYYQARFWLPLGVALAFIKLNQETVTAKQIN